MLLALGTCALVFYVTCAMIGRNIINRGLEQKNAPCLDLLGGTTTSFPVFWL